MLFYIHVADHIHMLWARSKTVRHPSWVESFIHFRIHRYISINAIVPISSNVSILHMFITLYSGERNFYSFPNESEPDWTDFFSVYTPIIRKFILWMNTHTLKAQLQRESFAHEASTVYLYRVSERVCETKRERKKENEQFAHSHVCLWDNMYKYILHCILAERPSEQFI